MCSLLKKRTLLATSIQDKVTHVTSKNSSFILYGDKGDINTTGQIYNGIPANYCLLLFVSHTELE